MAAAVWQVGALASNSHAAREPLDPADSAFTRAVALAEGRALLVLDGACEVYSRLDCCVEWLHASRVAQYEVCAHSIEQRMAWGRLRAV